MERDPLVRSLLVLLIAAVAFHLAGAAWNLAVRFGDIILLFFLAWLLAFTLSPVAQLLQRYLPLPWPLVVTLVYAGLLFVLVMATVLALPATVNQLYQLGRSLPDYAEKLPALTEGVRTWLLARRLPDIADVVRLEMLVQRVEAIGTALAQNALGIVQGVATAVFQVVIILILSFYVMLDGDRLAAGFVRLLPPEHRPDAKFYLQCIDRIFGGFMRGTLIQAAIYGGGTALVMWAAGLSYVLALSSFAGLVMVIPFVGTFLAILPPLIVAAFAGSWTKFLLVAIALLVLQQVVINVVAPKVMSQAVGIHPLVVFLSMLVGVQVAGIWGAIFGVPVAGVLNAMAFFLYERTIHVPDPGPDDALPIPQRRTS